MKMYEQLQSTTGQMATNQLALDIPGVPFVDFENRTLAIMGGIALVGGVIGTLRHTRTTSVIVDETTFPAGSDMNIKVRKNIFRGRGRELATGLAITTIATTGLLDAANPYTSETINEIDKMAVIVDAGYEGYAEDVTLNNGDVSNRINATINTLNQLELDGIEVSVIAAGKVPENVGVIKNGKGRSEVVENFTVYAEGSGGYAQRGSEANGGGDIQTALAIADGLNPDKILVFAGTFKGNDQSPVLTGEELEGNDKISVIAVGKSGSTVESFGAEIPAPIETAFNQNIVGESDSYSAETTEELKNVVNNIINSQVQSEELHDVKLFEKIRNITGIATIAGLYVLFQLQGNKPKYLKNRK